MGIRETTDNYAYSSMNGGRRDYECFYGVSERMGYYGMHCHDFYEFYIHFRGAEYYAVDNEVYAIRPNTLIVIPPFHMHGLIVDHDILDYERACLYLSPELLNRAGRGIVNVIGQLEEQTRGNRYLFSMTEAQARTCGRLIDQVQRAGSLSAEEEHLAMITGILPALCIIMEASRSEKHMAVGGDTVMHQVLVYINEHYAEPLGLRELSERFNISESTLSHEFYRYIRHSVYGYILYRRVMLAKQKLLGDASLSEICFQCGFGDYSNFLRAFRKVAGMSPSEYRRQVRTPGGQRTEPA